MLSIPYTGTQFKGPLAKFNKSDSLPVKWSELVWAAITVGKVAGDENAYGIYSALEKLHRAAMIRAYLKASGTVLIQTKVYEMSDPSEKTSISFYLGMTLAKLFAEKLFGVPKLLHFAVYKDNYVIAATQGKSRPDLIGQNLKGKWFVFEAKGRSNNFDQLALDKAKEQAKQIVSINTSAPLCRIGSEAFFDAGLCFQMVDPEHIEGDRSRRIEIDVEEADVQYYAPLETILASRDRRIPIIVNGRRLLEVHIPEADLWIGVPDRDASAKLVGRPRKLLPMEYLGGDGVLIRLGESWSDENMTLDPHQRSA
jgi:hypothetical protein